MMLDRNQRLQIAAQSAVDDRSIQRVYAGKKCRPATRRRVEETARALGLPLPENPIQSIDWESFTLRLHEEAKRIGPFVPDVDPHDLLLILERRLRPWGSGQKFFIRRTSNGHYVF